MFDASRPLTPFAANAHPLPPHRHWPRGGDRPILALHCSLAHAGAWSGLAERLTNLTLTGFDQIGHGRAPDWDGVIDLHDAATADAIAMAEALGWIDGKSGGVGRFHGVHYTGQLRCKKVSLLQFCNNRQLTRSTPLPTRRGKYVRKLGRRR